MSLVEKTEHLGWQLAGLPHEASQRQPTKGYQRQASLDGHVARNTTPVGRECVDYEPAIRSAGRRQDELTCRVVDRERDADLSVQLPPQLTGRFAPEQGHLVALLVGHQGVAVQ